MRRTRICRPVLLAILAIGITGTAGRVRGEDAVTPGEIRIDHPTLRCLGFRWLVSGDADGDATCTVQYRKKGDRLWREAQPMCRVNDEVADVQHGAWKCGNLFAGSVLFLDPGTAYECRFTMSDPDGGGAEKMVTPLWTRAVPVVPEGGPSRHVYPPGFEGERAEPAYDTIAAAFKAAAPGDTILLHAGVHKGKIALEKSGTAEKPFVFRAAPGDEGKAVVDGRNGKCFDIWTQSHFWFVDLVIRNASFAIKANECHGLVVMRCRMEDVYHGVLGYLPGTNWYIADNVIIGRAKTWYPRSAASRALRQPDNFGDATGINLCGSGHVACYNRVERFWDCIAVANHGRPKNKDKPAQMCIDIYNNRLSEAIDDNIECDFGSHNVRAWENLCLNAHVALSTQPFYGGPCYLIRNIAYGHLKPWKLHNYPQGVRAFHNTTIGTEQAFASTPPGWGNAIFRNNLILGMQRYAMETGSPHKLTSLDYNGWRKTNDPDRFIKWNDGKGYRKYATLKEFAEGTGHEAHGIMVEFDVFRKVKPPVAGKTYGVEDFDVRLAEGAPAIDAGERLPNINDRYLGEAPDVGALEYAPVPHYGPRPRPAPEAQPSAAPAPAPPSTPAADPAGG